MDNTTIEKNIQTLLVSIKKSSIYKEYKEQEKNSEPQSGAGGESQPVPGGQLPASE